MTAHVSGPLAFEGERVLAQGGVRPLRVILATLLRERLPRLAICGVTRALARLSLALTLRLRPEPVIAVLGKRWRAPSQPTEQHA